MSMGGLCMAGARRQKDRQGHSLKKLHFCHHLQLLPMGMSRSLGDVPRCERADEHHRPAEQVSSPAAAAGGSECCPPSSILSLGREAHGIPENSRSLTKWKKNLLPKGELCPWAAFLPVTLSILEESFRCQWPARLWAVPSCAINMCMSACAC